MTDMAKAGKKYRNSSDKIDKTNKYNFQEAVQLAIDCSYAKFDESVAEGIFVFKVMFIFIFIFDKLEIGTLEGRRRGA